MAFRDIREFIATLEKHGEVREIEPEVHWNLEAGAILRRTYELEVAAPFFQRITDYPGWRILGGSLASYKRIALALGLPPNTTYRQLMEEYARRRGHFIKPRIVKEAPCQENIILGDMVDLYQLPAPMIHDGDGGRYLCTWHATVTRDPDTGWVNWGMYRAMIHSKNTLAIDLEPQQHIGYHLYRKYEPRGQPMPCAFAIGTEPLSSLVAGTKSPYGVYEGEVAGALRGEPVELVKCRTIDLEVPATAEIVIEGEVLPKARVREGPFGEYTGYRTGLAAKRPLFQVKAITYRSDPILTMSCMGVPVDESGVTACLVLGADGLAELRAKGVPAADIHVFPQCAHYLVAVSVKPPYANVAQRIADILWGREWGDYPYVIVVEDDVDVHNIWQVLHALTTKCHPYRGIRRVQYATGFPLQPFLNRHERLHHLSAKVYFDCTWPMDWDRSIDVPDRASFDRIYPEEVQQHVLRKWTEYGFKEPKQGQIP